MIKKINNSLAIQKHPNHSKNQGQQGGINKFMQQHKQQIENKQKKHHLKQRRCIDNPMMSHQMINNTIINMLFHYIMSEHRKTEIRNTPMILQKHFTKKRKNCHLSMAIPYNINKIL